jgi:hypothetical protein
MSEYRRTMPDYDGLALPARHMGVVATRAG